MHKDDLKVGSSAIELVPELAGKTIVEAVISKTAGGDQELVIRCTDGSSFTIGAWQDEGHPVRIEVTRDS